MTEYDATSAVYRKDETMAKTSKVKVSGGGFYQIGEPKETSGRRAEKAASKAIEKIERARKTIGKALEPKTSITIKRGTK
jgi:hypothetical protein